MSRGSPLKTRTAGEVQHRPVSNLSTASGQPFGNAGRTQLRHGSDSNRMHPAGRKLMIVLTVLLGSMAYYYAASEDMLDKYSLPRSFYMTSEDHRATSALDMPIAVQQFLTDKNSNFAQQDNNKHENNKTSSSFSRTGHQVAETATPMEVLAARANIAIANRRHSITKKDNTTGLATRSAGENKASNTPADYHKGKNNTKQGKPATTAESPTAGKQSNRTSINVAGGTKVKTKPYFPQHLLLKRANGQPAPSLRDVMMARGGNAESHWLRKILAARNFTLSDNEDEELELQSHNDNTQVNSAGAHTVNGDDKKATLSEAGRAVDGEYKPSEVAADNDQRMVGLPGAKDALSEPSHVREVNNKGNSIGLKNADKEMFTPDDSSDNNVTKENSDVSFVHFQGCCGIGHRLARMSSAYHASQRLNFAIKGNWPSCQKVNVFHYLFETTTSGYLEPPTTDTVRSAQVFEVYNEVPGYHTVARSTSTSDDNANTVPPSSSSSMLTCDACHQDKIDSDYQFYNLLMNNFRKRQPVVDFMQQQKFANHTVIGMHVRAGNGEGGDFANKGRDISDLVKFIDRVSAQLANLTMDFSTPPLVFLATDTADVADRFRKTLSRHRIPLVTLPQIRASQGHGILFGAKKTKRQSRREKDIQRRPMAEERLRTDLDADKAEEDPGTEEQLQKTNVDSEAKEIEPLAEDLRHANHPGDTAAGDGAVRESHRASLPLTGATEETLDCLSTWDQAFMDMMLLAMSDVVVATRRSSFVQTLPLSIVTGTPQGERKVASPYCEISQDASLQMTCHESYMDWCCCASCVAAEDKERLRANKTKRPLEYVKQLLPDLREQLAEALYENNMKPTTVHLDEQKRLARGGSRN